MFDVGVCLLIVPQLQRVIAVAQQPGLVEAMVASIGLLLVIGVCAMLWVGVSWLRYLVAGWDIVSLCIYLMSWSAVLKNFDLERASGNLTGIILLAPVYLG